MIYKVYIDENTYFWTSEESLEIFDKAMKEAHKEWVKSLKQ
jgi:hypothetical protein